MVVKLISCFVIVFILLSTAVYSNSKLNEKSDSRINTISKRQTKVEIINSSQISKLIRERHGKVLLLNIWASWCVPCREEFPELIKLQKQIGNQNVEIAAISIDYSDELETKVIPFVNSQNLNFKTYIADISNDSELINMLNPQWNGALPATFVYNKNGEQTGTLLGKSNLNDFKKEIEKAKTK